MTKKKAKRENQILKINTMVNSKTKQESGAKLFLRGQQSVAYRLTCSLHQFNILLNSCVPSDDQRATAESCNMSQCVTSHGQGFPRLRILALAKDFWVREGGDSESGEALLVACDILALLVIHNIVDQIAVVFTHINKLFILQKNYQFQDKTKLQDTYQRTL